MIARDVEALKNNKSKDFVIKQDLFYFKMTARYKVVGIIDRGEMKSTLKYDIILRIKRIH